MKSFYAQRLLTILAVLTCASLAVAQDAPKPTTAYKYTAVNAPGASGTYAYAINNSKEIAGYITGGECSVISDQSSCGFVDVKGSFTTVACELNAATTFFDIDNQDEVVGATSIIGGVIGILWQGNESCFGLADPNGTAYTEAYGVANGKVVGYYIDSQTGNFQGFLYVIATQAYSAISCPGWNDTRAYGINDAGVIVGDVSNSTGGPFQGFIYRSGKCTTFNDPKASSTYARGINKSDQVSGWYSDATSGVAYGFVKTGNSFATLNVPKSVGTLAYHLNDEGQIAGWYEDTSSHYHGFVATPK